MSEPVIVAEAVRSGFVESRHRGSIVVTAPDGAVEWAAGVVDRPMFPRSSNKPLQAVGMLRLGLQLDGELLALAAASHSGEQFHLDGVRRILAGAGRTVSDLRTPAQYPVDEQAKEEWIRAGHQAEPITMNCSGKHAAMIATCELNGWPIHDLAGELTPGGAWGPDDYRSPDHPLQQAIRGTVEEIAGEKVAHLAVDGCGAPILSLSLAGLARSFGLIAAAPAGTPEHRVAEAFRQYPEYASGSRRDENDLIRSVPGLICKVGAEAVHAAGLPDGRGIAIKIEDGTSRARAALLAATLQHLGITNDTITSQLEAPLSGGGVQVGVVRPYAGLFA